MLIPFETIQAKLNQYKINITGVLHLGAHECEELPFYNKMGVTNNDVIWMDAIPAKISEAKARGIPNLYHAVVTDKDDEDVDFHVSNNVQSSSILEFGTHSTEHPWVHYVNTLRQKSITLDTFVKRNSLDISKHNLWNFDIQGAELIALRGAIESIKFAKAMILEVNEKELYKGCGLVGEIDTFLAKYKFKRVYTMMTPHGWGDALYVLEP